MLGALAAVAGPQPGNLPSALDGDGQGNVDGPVRHRAVAHTAATVLMLLGVPARVIDQIMEWEPDTSAGMRARYFHVPDAMLKDVARKITEAIWGTPETPAVDKNQDNEG